MSLKFFGNGRIEGVDLTQLVATGQFDPAYVPVPPIALDDLTDVDAAVPEDGDILVYDEYAGAWVAQPRFVPISATGGTVTDIDVSGTPYRVHMFSDVGTDSFVVTDVGNLGGEVEYVVVAGGGGGGGGDARFNGAGGGAGGYRSSVAGESSGGGASAESVFAVAVDSYEVIVGAGGLGGAASVPTVGGNSKFAGIEAVGGGWGGSQSGAAPGDNGGSGGGGRNVAAGGSGTANQGFDGADGAGSPTFNGGGGGGAGATGVPLTSPAEDSDGGIGVLSSITGTAVRRAGGGGGAIGYFGSGAVPTAGRKGLGGQGGGGDAGAWSASVAVAGESGVPNTGGGGGGTAVPDGNQKASGGNGGSGVVIIRYPLAA